MIRFLDKTPGKNQVGLVICNGSSNEAVSETIPVAPLSENRLRIADAVRNARAQGESALYKCIKTGIELTDEAYGDGNAIRGVVVLTDGKNTTGNTRLHEIFVAVRSKSECLVEEVGDDQSGYRLVDCT